MLRVKTYLDKSNVEGIGLFAGEDILKGTIIWEFTPDIDIDLPMHGNPTKLETEFLQKYAYFDKQLHNWILPADDDRFINHSENPNTEPLLDGSMVASRDIKKGEEMTCDYYAIDYDADIKLNK